MRKPALLSFACFLLIINVACSSGPEPNKQESSLRAEAVAKKEPVLYTGKSCLSRMMDQAQRWSVDALPVHLESKANSESLGHDGKATVWKGTFVSASRRMARIFSCSGSRLPDEPVIGISASLEMVSPPALAIFHPSYLVTDSDAAFALSEEKGGSKVLEKYPQQPVVYTLDWDAKHKQLVWVVIYGESTEVAKGIGIIDASTGKFLRAK